jgi:dTDP-glucose 4,6-dehydratase
LLVTGGAGFIGTNFVRRWRARAAEQDRLVVLDAFTYAGHRESLADVPGIDIVQGDVADAAAVERTLGEHGIQTILHLAAETHVDRSILDASAFVRTNVLGTATLLEAARQAGVRRFVHVSTDEVYGELGPDRPPSLEDAPLRPRSPYAASKAGAEHLAWAYAHTHGLPLIVARPSNTYGPYQLPEKLIPVMIERAAAGRPLPVYGDGAQRREWLHVDDHCAALELLLTDGVPGEAYNIGSGDERSNLDVVRAILARVGAPETLIEHVRDRPGHDRRYAIDSTKLRGLGWRPARGLADGLAATVDWYRDRRPWVDAVRAGSERFLHANYADRGGLR